MDYDLILHDWSSDVCSSDLPVELVRETLGQAVQRKLGIGL